MQIKTGSTLANVSLPVLAIGGETGLGEMMGQMMRKVADNVMGCVIPNCGHYVPEEAPNRLNELLSEFFRKR